MYGDYNKIYVIEPRDEQGHLLLDCPEPYTIFGTEAIHGITLEKIANIVYRQHPEALLQGTNIPNWAKCFNKNWVVREKTW